MPLLVEVLLGLLAGGAAGVAVSVRDAARLRRERAFEAAFGIEPEVDDAWHCATCHFLATLRRSEYGREWRANLLAAIDRGAPAHGPIDWVMREAPPLAPRTDLVPDAPPGEPRSAGDPR